MNGWDKFITSQKDVMPVQTVHWQSICLGSLQHGYQCMGSTSGLGACALIQLTAEAQILKHHHPEDQGMKSLELLLCFQFPECACGVVMQYTHNIHRLSAETLYPPLKALLITIWVCVSDHPSIMFCCCCEKKAKTLSGFTSKSTP